MSFGYSTDKNREKKLPKDWKEKAQVNKQNSRLVFILEFF
jgi:hypothetical protein